MRTVIVTGATGFLGRALVERLRASAGEVVAVSRSSGPGLHTVTDYRETPAGDVIVHLAEEPHRARVNAQGEAYKTCTAATVRALAERAGRLIYASSATVYGDTGGTASGVDAPVFASDTYTSSKLGNEKIVLDAGGLVLRLANLYGPGMSPENVLSDIARQIPGSGPLRVRDAFPVRDFLPVDDAAAALRAAAFSTHASKVVNVGSGAGMSVQAIAQLALDEAGEGTRTIVSTAPSAGRSYLVVEISRTTELLGWAPALPLHSALREFFRKGQQP